MPPGNLDLWQWLAGMSVLPQATCLARSTLLHATRTFIFFFFMTAREKTLYNMPYVSARAVEVF